MREVFNNAVSDSFFFYLSFVLIKQRHAWPFSGITNASTLQKQRKGSAHGAVTQSTTGCGSELSFTPEPAFTPQHITLQYSHHRQAFTIHACGFSVVFFSLLSISDFFHISPGGLSWRQLSPPLRHLCKFATRL